MTYSGVALELPQWPRSQDELLETEDGTRRLFGYLVRRQADRTKVTSEHGQILLDLNFKH